MRIKGKKATVGITLPPEMVRKAREYGLNISKICENALKIYIKRLEESETETNGGADSIRASRSPEFPEILGRDLNPRPPPYQGDAQPG